MPVVETEYQRCPSAVLSRATMRAHRGSSATDGVAGFGVLVDVIVIILHSHMALDQWCRQFSSGTLRSLLSNPTARGRDGREWICCPVIGENARHSHPISA